MWDSGSPRALGTRLGTFDSCHPDHFGDLRIRGKSTEGVGNNCGSSCSARTTNMESKPVKVLGRPAKTDAPFWG